MSGFDIATLGLEVRSDGVVVASDRLNKFGQDAARAERATDQLSNAFRRFAPLVGTVMAAFSARAIKEYADSWSDMQSRVGAAVKNMEAAPALMERIVDIANASYSPLAQTAEVYSRNMATLRDYGRSAMEAADFTEALNHALVITATKGQDADVVINAYSRAISNGKLRTMEFETIMSRSPRLLEAVADHMGVTVTQLRRLAAEGKVTGEALIAGPTNALEKLAAEAAEMPATVGDAFQRIETNFQALVGRVDQATGASESLALKFVGLADAIRAGTDDVVRAALVIQTGLAAAMDWASNAASALGSQFDSASTMIILGAGAAGFAVTALATAITGTLIRAVFALVAVLAANPFALFIAGATAAVTAAYLFRDEIKQAVGVDVVEVMVDVGNKTIGIFVGTYNAVQEAWSNLPTFFAAIGKSAWNALAENLKGSITFSNPFTGAEWGRFEINLSGAAQSKLTAAEERAFERAAGTFRQDFDHNYIEGFGEAIGEAWRNSEQATAAFDDLSASLSAANDNMGGAAEKAGKASKEAQKLADAYKRIVDAGKEFIAQQELELRLIGMNEQAANALRYEFGMLADAKAAGITLTEQQTQELGLLAQGMAAAEAATKALKEAYDFARDTVKGFVSDLRQGLQNGEGFFRAFANAATRAIDRITDKLLNDLVDALFTVNNAASDPWSGMRTVGGGGGGFLGFIGKLFGFQSGGYTGPGAAHQPAGIVHAGEYVFSKAAVDRIGLGYLDSLHSAAKGYMLGGYVTPRALRPANVNLPGYQAGGNVRPFPQQSAQPVDVRVDVRAYVDQDGNWQAAVERIADERSGAIMGAGFRELDRALPDRVAQINQHPRRR